ncbi:hypothetical protein ACQCX2_13900 [Propionibacteriaceae bacterium Y1700]|uniref:hypothetical protein n=1 Tax=Microlunatus sp. Y1700 TaxID=3418487 RepID=UPI003DA7A08F
MGVSEGSLDFRGLIATTIELLELYRHQDVDLITLIGDTELCADGMPWDLAVWDDWVQLAQRTEPVRVPPRSQEPPVTFRQGFLIMTDVIWHFGLEAGDDLLRLQVEMGQLDREQHGRLQAMWIEAWRKISEGRPPRELRREESVRALLGVGKIKLVTAEEVMWHCTRNSIDAAAKERVLDVLHILFNEHAMLPGERTCAGFRAWLTPRPEWPSRARGELESMGWFPEPDEGFVLQLKGLSAPS